MSLAIDVDNVTAVLLQDGWHQVVENSFDSDAYEFFHEGHSLIGGGRVEGVSATGATWKERDGSRVACPFPSVLAVKFKVTGKKKGSS